MTKPDVRHKYVGKKFIHITKGREVLVTGLKKSCPIGTGLNIKYLDDNSRGTVTYKYLEESKKDFRKEIQELKAIVESGFINVNARLDTIERDTSEIRKHFFYRDEFENLQARVKYLEKKLGIISGK